MTRKEKKKKIKQFYKEYKSSCCCVICGSIDHLEFHHIKDKIDTISNIVKNKLNIKFLIEELKKCVPVCRECHVEIHREV